MAKQSLIIISFLMFTVLAACQTTPTKIVDLHCKSNFFYECLNGECKKQETQALEFFINDGKGSINIYSIQTKDSSPSIFKRDGKTQFFLNTVGESVGGEKVKVSVIGQVLPNKKFQALVDGVHYEGSCD